jgi:tripartite-type tricarboxylate transporter receptor subunit TctC
MRNAFRVSALLLTLSIVLSITSRSTLAAGYPDRTVKVIVPFPAGGVTDIAARLITQKLSERLGQQFYIENIGGAGGNLGMANAAHAAPDGYTVLFASSSIVVNPSLYRQVPFNVENDFIPVTKLSVGIALIPCHRGRIVCGSCRHFWNRPSLPRDDCASSE